MRSRAKATALAIDLDLGGVDAFWRDQPRRLARAPVTEEAAPAEQESQRREIRAPRRRRETIDAGRQEIGEFAGLERIGLVSGLDEKDGARLAVRRDEPHQAAGFGLETGRRRETQGLAGKVRRFFRRGRRLGEILRIGEPDGDALFLRIGEFQLGQVNHGERRSLAPRAGARRINGLLGLTNYSFRLKRQGGRGPKGFRDMREASFKPLALGLAIRPDSDADRVHPLSRAALVGVALAALFALSGCKTVSMDDITGSIAAPTKPASSSQADLRAFSEQLRRLYEAHPGDKKIAMAYAKSLRARGLNDQAAAVMENIAIKYPKDHAVLAAFGKALADDGQLQRAQDVLSHADSPDDPNWSVVSTRGSIADQLGDHQAARQFYETALKLAPGEPSVMSNLGLSYALSHDLTDAENVMRQAAASPRADMRERQNLALVLALQGKFAEAEKVSERDLPPDQARENVASIRQMISQSNDWRDIQTSAAPRSRTTSIARSTALPARTDPSQAAIDGETSAASRKMEQLSVDASAR